MIKLIIFLLSINLFSYQKFYQMDNSKIDKTIKGISKESSISKKIVNISNLFINTPYEIDPLGEGNKKPLYSFKGVDCVTFVESVIAASYSDNLISFKDNLQKIRYRNGEVNYNRRNHIMISQWIPNNIENGFIKEITQDLVDNKNIRLKTIKKEITKKTYNNRKFKKFLKIDDIPIGEYLIKYISIDDFIKYYYKIDIPNGTIMTIVRKDLNNYPIMISHLGFIVKKNKRYYFRNATRSTKFKLVRDAKLMPYLRFYNSYYKSKKWPIIGIQFFEVIDKKSNKDIKKNISKIQSRN